MTRRQFLFAAAALPALATGCSKGNKLVPVSGTVTIDGKPVEAGKVQFSPSNDRAAFGNIDKNGRFTMTTFAEGDGVVMGSHPVAIISHETLGPSKQRWHAPKRYMSADTSQITVEITGPTDNLEIKLTWAGDSHKEPFIEGSTENEGKKYE